MSTETLHQILTALLTVGCAPLIKWIVDQVKEEFNPSPRTTRRLAYLYAAIVPSIVYGLLAVIQGLYEWPAHLLAVIGAFTGATFIHGEQDLPNGAQVAAARRLDAIMAVPTAVSVKVLEDGGVIVAPPTEEGGE